MQNLDGDLAGKDRVLRAENLAHATGRHLLDDVIATIQRDQRVSAGVAGSRVACQAAGRLKTSVGKAERSRCPIVGPMAHGGGEARRIPGALSCSGEPRGARVTGLRGRQNAPATRRT